MVVGFTTTYAISAFHHSSCEFSIPLRRDVLDTTLCDNVCQWFSPVSSTNKTDCHDITEILFKVALNTINPILLPIIQCNIYIFLFPQILYAILIIIK
jgi:hypothetical protein